MNIRPKIQVANVGEIVLNVLPDHCPFCHKSINPKPITGFISNQELQVFLACPDMLCQKAFIGYYKYGGSPQHISEFKGQTSTGTLITKHFSVEVTSMFLDFTKIYNEAYSAEQQNLLEICGVGYRKALEYLIKDYAILKHSSKKEQIEKSLLGKVILDFVSDVNIKSVSKRAVWLGNDETHYIRKWEGKNLLDLKKLIDLTLHWIEMETLTASFELEMPD